MEQKSIKNWIDVKNVTLLNGGDIDQTSPTEPALFSFAIVSYKNYKYIFEAVDSVLKQTYPKIELIISNDGSSDFNSKELQSYIEKNKRNNIIQINICNNEKNLGTVKNVESIRRKAHGEYIMYMAADDALFDETILQKFVEQFEKFGSQALVMTCRTAMCGTDLKQVIDYQPDQYGIKAIKLLSPQQMFSRLSHTFTIPTTSTCYRMTLYDILGPYDTDYYIIEDAPLYARISRLGIKIYWIDNMVAARHRDGGISHGKTKKVTESYRRYRFDEITFYEKEILPYEDRILSKDYPKMIQKWEYIKKSYHETFQISKFQRIRNKVDPLLSRIIELLNPAPKTLLSQHTLEPFLLFAWLLCWGTAALCLEFGKLGMASLEIEALSSFWFKTGSTIVLTCLILLLSRLTLFYGCWLLRLTLKIVTIITNKICSRKDEKKWGRTV